MPNCRDIPRGRPGHGTVGVDYSSAMERSVVYALLAAVLFGASTPVAKLFAGQASPLLLGGLLYLGSGLGLAVLRLARDRGWQPSGLNAGEWPWLLGAIVFGGMLGPVALMFGLTRVGGATASLLLNLESALTAAIAWLVLREHAPRRVVLGMAAIVAGGVALAWPAGTAEVADWPGPLAIAAACLCWAIDNNLTRKVSASDALFIAGGKGLIAGVVNTALAVAVGAQAPGLALTAATLVVGLFGYGLSLVLFVLALRGLGAARTGAYFAIAPFIGAALAIGLAGEATTPAFWLAAVLMGLGVWLHLTERHDHLHAHEPLEHAHPHVHDAHHQHAHAFPWHGDAPHEHWHRHEALTHKHPHFPDIHHRHEHDAGHAPVDATGR